MGERRRATQVTDTWLRNLKPGPDIVVPGRRGLNIRVEPSGTRTFRFRYSRNGRSQTPIADWSLPRHHTGARL